MAMESDMQGPPSCPDSGHQFWSLLPQVEATALLCFPFHHLDPLAQ